MEGNISVNGQKENNTAMESTSNNPKIPSTGFGKREEGSSGCKMEMKFELQNK